MSRPRCHRRDCVNFEATCVRHGFERRDDNGDIVGRPTDGPATNRWHLFINGWSLSIGRTRARCMSAFYRPGAAVVEGPLPGVFACIDLGRVRLQVASPAHVQPMQPDADTPSQLARQIDLSTRPSLHSPRTGSPRDSLQLAFADSEIRASGTHLRRHCALLRFLGILGDYGNVAGIASNLWRVTRLCRRPGELGYRHDVSPDHLGVHSHAHVDLRHVRPVSAWLD